MPSTATTAYSPAVVVAPGGGAVLAGAGVIATATVRGALVGGAAIGSPLGLAEGFGVGVAFLRRLKSLLRFASGPVLGAAVGLACGGAVPIPARPRLA